VSFCITFDDNTVPWVKGIHHHPQCIIWMEGINTTGCIMVPQRDCSWQYHLCPSATVLGTMPHTLASVMWSTVCQMLDVTFFHDMNTRVGLWRGSLVQLSLHFGHTGGSFIVPYKWISLSVFVTFKDCYIFIFPDLSEHIQASQLKVLARVHSVYRSLILTYHTCIKKPVSLDSYNMKPEITA
jgi:hypothetical protein